MNGTPAIIFTGLGMGWDSPGFQYFFLWRRVWFLWDKGCTGKGANNVLG